MDMSPRASLISRSRAESVSGRNFSLYWSLSDIVKTHTSLGASAETRTQVPMTAPNEGQNTIRGGGKTKDAGKEGRRHSGTEARRG